MLGHRFGFRLAAALVVAVALAGCGGAAQREAAYLAKGKEYLARKDYDKARVELKNVLQIDPKDAEGYYLLGTVEEKQRNFQQAFGFYHKAVQLNPDYVAARVHLGQFYFLAGNTAKAEAAAKVILSKDPNNPGGRTLDAAIRARNGDDSGAIKEASAVLSHDPTYENAVDLLVAVYLKEKQPDEAMAILRKALVSSPRSVSLRSLELRVLVAKKDIAGVEKVYQEIIALKPKEWPPRFALAAFYAKTNQPDKAETTLRDAVRADPQDSTRYLALADFLAQRRSVAAAEKELLDAIAQYPKAYALRFGLAKLYENANADDKAGAVYQDIIGLADTDPEGLRARDQWAALLLKQGKQDKAATLIAKVLEKNPGDNEALVLKGEIALGNGKATDAITAFRSVLKDQPNSVPVLSLLASALYMNKDAALAQETLQKAVDRNPQDPSARLSLAQFYAQTGDQRDASHEVTMALAVAPNDPQVLLAAAKMQAGGRDLAGAEKTLKKLRDALPNNPVAYYRLGQLYAAQRKFDDAVKYFELAMQRSPDKAQPLAEIVNVRVAQGKPRLAIARLREALKANPKDPVPHELLAGVYAHQKKYHEAGKELNAAITLNPKWDRPYVDLASLADARGDTQGAITADLGGLQAIPGDAGLSMQLAGEYEKAGQYDQAIATYEGILAKAPDDVVAANNLAAMIADHRTDAQDLDRAKRLAQEIASSNNLAFRDTVGWVDVKTGQAAKAVPILEQVVKQAPQIGVFQYHLGMAYYLSGNKAGARTCLAKALASRQAFFGTADARAILAKLR